MDDETVRAAPTAGALETQALRKKRTYDTQGHLKQNAQIKKKQTPTKPSKASSGARKRQKKAARAREARMARRATGRTQAEATAAEAVDERTRTAQAVAVARAVRAQATVTTRGRTIVPGNSIEQAEQRLPKALEHSRQWQEAGRAALGDLQTRSVLLARTPGEVMRVTAEAQDRLRPAAGRDGDSQDREEAASIDDTMVEAYSNMIHSAHQKEVEVRDSALEIVMPAMARLIRSTAEDQDTHRPHSHTRVYI